MLDGSDDCTLLGSADGILLGSVLGSATEPDAEPDPSLVGVLVCTKSKVGSVLGSEVGSEDGALLGDDVVLSLRRLLWALSNAPSVAAVSAQKNCLNVASINLVPHCRLRSAVPAV